MTDLEAARIEIEMQQEIEAKATPAGWRIDPDGENAFGNVNSEGWNDNWVDLFSTKEDSSLSPENANEIMAARNAHRVLLDIAKAAAEAVGPLRRWATHLRLENDVDCAASSQRYFDLADKLDAALKRLTEGK